jgi:hypothetical protein
LRTGLAARRDAGSLNTLAKMHACRGFVLCHPFFGANMVFIFFSLTRDRARTGISDVC